MKKVSKACKRLNYIFAVFSFHGSNAVDRGKPNCSLCILQNPAHVRPECRRFEGRCGQEHLPSGEGEPADAVLL